MVQKKIFFSDMSALDNWLNSRGMFHMQLGLDRMRKALAAMGLERPPFRVAQVIGTNGKGSTCAFLSALAKSNGVKAGTYTSPHFLSIRERILVNGDQCSEHIWLTGANDIFTALGPEPDLTYFEFLTVLALHIFRQQEIALAILEAGLGGQNDATSAIEANVHCFTSIALDHASIIGPGIEDIARDKSKAMRARAFSCSQYPGVKRIMENEAQTRGLELTFVEPLADLPACSLNGFWQKANAALAFEAWIWLFGQTSLTDLGTAFIPGRMQYLAKANGHGPLILDGAHNPHGMSSLARGLTQSPEAIIFSCLEDKDWKTALAIIGRSFPLIPLYLVQLDNERACKQSLLNAYAKKLFPERRIITCSLEQALKAEENSIKPVLVTGSLYLLAAFYELYPDCLVNKNL